VALTTKRRTFIEHYLACWNATEAAKAAGYAYPSREGWRLLNECEDVQTAVRERLAEKAMTADEVLTRLAEQARGNLGDFVEVHDDGTWTINLKRAREAEKLGLIKTLWVDRRGTTRIELHDPQRALELLAKHHGLFSDAANINVGIAVGPQIILDDGSS